MRYLAHRCDSCLRETASPIADPEGMYPVAGPSELPEGWIGLCVHVGPPTAPALHQDLADRFAATMTRVKAAVESGDDDPEAMKQVLAEAFRDITAPRVLVGRVGRAKQLEICPDCVRSLVVTMRGESLVPVA